MVVALFGVAHLASVAVDLAAADVVGGADETVLFHLLDPLGRLRAAAFAHFRGDHIQTGFSFRLLLNRFHAVPSNPVGAAAC